MATTELNAPLKLAFDCKLDPSDALFSAGCWSQRDHGSSWPAITVQEIPADKHRCSQSRGRRGDRLQSGAVTGSAQTVDVAMLPKDADTLRVRFALRVLGGVAIPSQCSDAGFRKRLSQAVAHYTREHGFAHLAYRYAHNIANGRFLWRNRIGAENIDVVVRQIFRSDIARQWHFDALALPLREFVAPPSMQGAVQELAEVIEQALCSEKYLLFEVVAYVRMREGQEVFPSQELVLKRHNNNEQKHKALYSVNGIAGIHRNKIDNALRTIDTWYPDGNELGPIAIEPYGLVSAGRESSQTYRKRDCYSLLETWVHCDQQPVIQGDHHYVMANLVRGGVLTLRE